VPPVARTGSLLLRVECPAVGVAPLACDQASTMCLVGPSPAAASLPPLPPLGGKSSRACMSAGL